MADLKYNQRNIANFTYDYNTSNRAVCPVSVILEIYKAAIAQGMVPYEGGGAGRGRYNG